MHYKFNKLEQPAQMYLNQMLKDKLGYLPDDLKIHSLLREGKITLKDFTKIGKYFDFIYICSHFDVPLTPYLTGKNHSFIYINLGVFADETALRILKKLIDDGTLTIKDTVDVPGFGKQSWRDLVKFVQFVR